MIASSTRGATRDKPNEAGRRIDEHSTDDLFRRIAHEWTAARDKVVKRSRRVRTHQSVHQLPRRRIRPVCSGAMYGGLPSAAVAVVKSSS